MMAALHAVNKILLPMSHFVYSWNIWLHYKTKCCHGTLVKAVCRHGVFKLEFPAFSEQE